MSLHTSETESENETLSTLFSKGLSIHDSVCADEGDTNSAMFQEKVRKGIMILEDATRLVSILDLFSRNEHVRDIPTDSLKFFLLPVLLGNEIVFEIKFAPSIGPITRGTSGLKSFPSF